MIPSAPRTIVLGAGRMGAYHLESILASDRLRLAGILERDPGRHGDLSTRYAVPVHDSLDALCAIAAPEAAIVATPDSTHVSLARACLAQGLHVLVEKPLAPRAIDAAPLVAEFLEAGRILSIGMVEGHNPAWNAFLAATSLVGDLRSLSIRRTSRGSRSRESDILHDLAIHDLDLLWTWLGASPRLDRDEASLSPARILLSGGAPVPWTLEAAWTSEAPDRRWSLRGSLGDLLLDLAARTLRHRPLDGPEVCLPVEGQDSLRREQASFADAIASGDPLQEARLERHLEILALCDAMVDLGSG